VSRAAVRHLKRVDPTLRRVIERVGPCRLTLRTEGVDFDHLARAIVYQQLAGKAAAAIHGRLLGLYGDRPPTPAELLGTPAARLRRAGLSRQKLAYLRALARHVHTGALPLGDLSDLADEAIIEAVTQVQGIGVWTAQMFLMFRLGRPDVLPALDFGIRNAVRLAYGLRTMPTAAQLERIAAPWRPYRTVACWYLWRSLDVRTP
jgi:DNA-3-methyladenine glycosylase II